TKPGHEPWADCTSQVHETDPKCWITANTINFPLDPHDGTSPVCWRPSSWDGQYCDPNACGTFQMDFATILRHEVGHSLGLDDDPDGLLMRPSFDYCPLRRYAATCELDTLRRRYHDNPAAAISDLTVTRQGADARIDWKWIGGSTTRRWHVTYSPDWSSAAQFVA